MNTRDLSVDTAGRKKTVPKSAIAAFVLVGVYVALVSRNAPLESIDDLQSDWFLEAAFTFSPFALGALILGLYAKRVVAREPEHYKGRFAALLGSTFSVIALLAAVPVAVGVAIILFHSL